MPGTSINLTSQQGNGAPMWPEVVSPAQVYSDRVSKTKIKNRLFIETYHRDTSCSFGLTVSFKHVARETNSQEVNDFGGNGSRPSEQHFHTSSKFGANILEHQHATEVSISTVLVNGSKHEQTLTPKASA